MADRESLDAKARTFFDTLWTQGDPWAFETSAFEAAKYERQIDMIGDRRYPRALEIGCGAGVFTRRLASIADEVLAIDVSSAAIAIAESRRTPGIRFRVANVMEFDPAADAPWDLVVMSETIYYLGWLYPFFDVAWLAGQLHNATRPGGRLLMANTFGQTHDYLLRPWILATYHDLFVNVGFEVERDEMFRGMKNDVELESQLLLFVRTSAEAVH